MVIEVSRWVLDTNIALYYLGNCLEEELPSGEYFVSIITEIELLAYPDLSATETEKVHEFLSCLNIVNINNAIKELTIQWRQKYRLKLPDAIIVATTLHLDATLLTNDLRLVKLLDLPTRSLARST